MSRQKRCVSHATLCAAFLDATLRRDPVALALLGVLGAALSLPSTALTVPEIYENGNAR